MIYLDNAATSFIKPPCVAEAVFHSFGTIGNAGRGAHEPTLNASRLIYKTRTRIARLFGIDQPSRIAFTANVTEALNIAASCLPFERAVTSVCEHNSVLRPLFRREEEGLPLTVIGADDLGRIRMDELTAAAGPACAVFLSHAGNLTGNVNDIARISSLVHRQGGLFVVDAAQSAGEIPIDVREMGIDVLCFTGHKAMMGPQGTGGIYVRPGLDIVPFKVGGSGVHSYDRHQPPLMPTLLEAGTLNGHGLAGLCAAAAFLLDTGVENIHEKVSSLAGGFARQVRDIPGIRLYGDYDAPLRAPLVTLNIGDMDSSLVSDILWDRYEICTRAGAHCAPLMHKALGTQDQGAVRFSFSWFNTDEEAAAAAAAVREIVRENL